MQPIHGKRLTATANVREYERAALVEMVLKSDIIYLYCVKDKKKREREDKVGGDRGQKVGRGGGIYRICSTKCDWATTE